MDFSPSVYEHAAYLIDRTPWFTALGPNFAAKSSVSEG